MEEAGELNQIGWWMCQPNCPHIHLYNYRQEFIIKLLSFCGKILNAVGVEEKSRAGVIGKYGLGEDEASAEL